MRKALWPASVDVILAGIADGLPEAGSSNSLTCWGFRFRVDLFLLFEPNEAYHRTMHEMPQLLGGNAP